MDLIWKKRKPLVEKTDSERFCDEVESVEATLRNVPFRREFFCMYTLGSKAFCKIDCPTSIDRIVYDMDTDRFLYDLTFRTGKSGKEKSGRYRLNSVIKYDEKNDAITGVFSSKDRAVKAYGEWASRVRKEKIAELERELARLKGER